MKSVFKKVIVAILTWEAQMVLKRYKPRIVAVTGSVGKTSTKDAIFTALCADFFVRKSEKSFNSEVGIPLTILGLQNAWSNPIGWIKNIFEGFGLVVLYDVYPEWLVLEVGADRPGDIKSVAKWLKPNIVVMTRIPEVPVHVEFFPTPEALAREKRYLAEGVRSDGVLILNADDERISAITHPYKGRIIQFGFNDGADVRGVGYRTVTRKGVPAGTSLKVRAGADELIVTITGALGVQHAYPYLAAIAVAESLGLNQERVAEALCAHIPPPGRMRLLEGIKETTVIDDTYNASPTAVEMALETLGALEVPGRRIAVLGDMMELGKYSAEAHREMGTIVAKTAQLLFAVGIRSQATVDGARDAGMDGGNVKWYGSAAEAGKELQVMLEPGDVVLVKGSQSMRMERIVEEVMAHPERKEELLVRQDPVWRSKV